MIPIVIEPHPQPLPAGGEGRQSTALEGWGSSVLVSHQGDMILRKMWSKILFLRSGNFVMFCVSPDLAKTQDSALF